MQPLPIAHVIKNLPFHGGTTHYLYGLLSALDLHTFPTIIIVLERDAPGDSYADAFTRLGVDVTYLHMRQRFDTQALTRMRHLLQDHHTAIVQTHLARSHIYGGLTASLLRRPVVVTEHGIPRNRTLPVRLWDNLFGQLAARIVCNSDATRRAVQQDLPVVNRHKMVVVYPGVADCAPVVGDPVTRSSLGLRPDDWVVGFTGTFVSWRRHEFLLEVFRRVHEQIPRARLVLMGEGPLQDTVAAQVQALGLSQAVHILGTRADARQILHLLDVYVNPADAEAFGIATVEAMLASLPIVVANRGALPELIDHEHTGLVADAANTDAFAAAVLRALTDRRRAKQWGEAARQNALVRFSPAQFADHFASIYRSVYRG